MGFIERLYEAIPGGVTHMELKCPVHEHPRVIVEFLYDEATVNRHVAIIAAVKKLEADDLADPDSIERFETTILKILGVLK